MPQQKAQVSPMMVFGVLFTVIALVSLIALFMLKSKADTTEQQAGVENTPPVVDSLAVSDVSGSGDIGPAGLGVGFTPNEGMNKIIYVRGQLSDLNGCNNLMQATVTLYRSDIPGSQSCTSDKNDCYHTTLYPVDFVGCDSTGDTTVSFETSFELPNFVDPTDVGSPNESTNWLAYVSVSDNAEAQAVLTETYETNSLAAFSVPGSIDYGTVALGEDSSAVQLTFSNTGNREVDSDVIALVDPVHQPEPLVGDMTSNISGYADIPASAAHYSLSELFVYGSDDVAVSKTAATDLALALPQQTDDLTIPTTDTFWKLRLPSTGVNGTYSNVLVFTAKAAAEQAVQLGALDTLVSNDYSQSGGVERSYADTYDTQVQYITSDTVNSMKVVNLHIPSNPTLITTVNSTLADVTSIGKQGNYIFLSNMSNTNNLQVIDVTDPASPSIETTMTAISGGIVKAFANGPYAYVIGGTNKFEILDIETPTNPTVIPTSVINFDEDVKDFVWTGVYVYVYTEDATHGYVHVIDTTDPAAPVVVGSSFQTFTDAKIADVGNGHLVVVGNNTDFANTVQLIDRSNPTFLFELDTLSINNNRVNSVAASGNFVYVSDSGVNTQSSNINAIYGDPMGNLVLMASKQYGPHSESGTVYNLYAENSYVFASSMSDGIQYTLMAAAIPKSGGDKGGGK